MVDVLYRYVGDVLEGMDLIYRVDNELKDKNKTRLLEIMMSCVHMDEKGNVSQFFKGDA